MEEVSEMIKRIEAKLRILARSWWRPFAQWSAGIAVFVNGVYKPLILDEGVDLANLAILITAVSTLVAIRGAEKHFSQDS
jgi:hypothetical protein